MILASVSGPVNGGLRPAPARACAALLALVLALPAAAEKPSRLRPGRYRAVVSGPVCNACTDAIVAELLKIPGVEAASYDFEEGVLWLTVAKDKNVRVSRVERALSLASRRVDLGARYLLRDIQPGL